MRWRVGVVVAVLLVVGFPVGVSGDDGGASKRPGCRKELLPVGAAFDGFAGCLVVENLGTGEVALSDVAECRRRSVPCSTFKIPHTLIALETGVVEDIEARFHWDGSRQAFPFWERDHDLITGMAFSVVWAYQRIARAIGSKRMQRWLALFQYGNEDISGGIDTFWLGGGSLQISPLEQARFLALLGRHALPISRGPAWRLSEALPDFGDVEGKTGSSGDLGAESVGWFVGLVHKDDGRQFSFAVRLRGQGASGATAREAALDLLARPEIIAPDLEREADVGTVFCGDRYHPSTRQLICTDHKVHDLAPLLSLPNLEAVNIHLADKLDSLAPLAKLRRLRFLGLFDSDVTDLPTLSGVDTIEELTLSDKGLADLAPLATMPRLRSLELHGTRSWSLEPLSGLGHLAYLSFSRGKDVDLTPLARMAALGHLVMYGDTAVDLAPLGSSPTLTELEIQDAHDGELDLTPLAGIGSLTRLFVDGWNGSDLSVLGAAVGLRRLKVSGSGALRVAQMPWLAKLTALQRLSLDNVGLADPTPVARLTRLERLSLEFNPIERIDMLSGLNRLERLSLRSTRLTDISVVRKMPELRHVGLPCRVEDLAPLAALPHLEHLVMCVAEDVSATATLQPLSHANHLYHLRVVAEGALDVGPLSGLPELSELYLRAPSLEHAEALLALPRLSKLEVACAPLPKDVYLALVRRSPAVEVRKKHCQEP